MPPIRGVIFDVDGARVADSKEPDPGIVQAGLRRPDFPPSG